MGNQLLFDVSVALYAYSPVEPVAEDLACKAVAWGSNAQGCSVPVGVTPWYVSYSRCTALPTKQVDQLTGLTHYRAVVSWRIAGQAL